MEPITLRWEKPEIEEGFAREFFDANGVGGYASSTIFGANTRRYHGLLVADMGPPLGRVVTLSKLEETVLVNGNEFELSTNHYPGTVHPKGYRYVREFRKAQWPVTVFEFGGVTVEKHVFTVYGENTVVVFYKLTEGSGPVKMHVRPLVAFRNYHSLTHENSTLNRKVTDVPNGFSIRPYDSLPGMTVFHNASGISDEYNWYSNFCYDMERQRGLDFDEDLFMPCAFTFELAEGKPAWLAATVESRNVFDFEEVRDAELNRRRSVLKSGGSDAPWAPHVAAAAEDFLVARPDGICSISAGYPWFAEWGRDAMISIPGLQLARGCFKEAGRVLLRFASGMKDGLIPNFFSEEGGESDYNTVDASLWFIHALAAHFDASGDRALLEELYPKAVEVVESYMAGTINGIKMDSDGLVRHGPRLTWMDAKVGDWIVTPRAGKAVEISALWYNALASLARLSKVVEKPANKYIGLLPRIRNSFVEKFFFEQGGYLYDVLEENYKDARVRPNQLFAVSLPYSPLPDEIRKGVVSVVSERLAVPGGVRTLAQDEDGYQGSYLGDQTSRDGAYHRGTAWPWLLAPYAKAFVRVNGYDIPWLKKLIEPVQSLLSRQAIGQMPEILDGDEPHTPRGAFAQAWSVAAVLEILEMINNAPKFQDI
jgi:predicted glycogen debranching enzyme